jgi:hypothetical protein
MTGASRLEHEPPKSGDVVSESGDLPGEPAGAEVKSYDRATTRLAELHLTMTRAMAQLKANTAMTAGAKNKDRGLRSDVSADI